MVSWSVNESGTVLDEFFWAAVSFAFAKVRTRRGESLRVSVLVESISDGSAYSGETEIFPREIQYNIPSCLMQTV